jgi:hypothetical protein
MISVKKGETFRYLRGKKEVTPEAREAMKEFSRVKKLITEALSGNDLTIDQLTDRIKMPKKEVVFYLMSMVKYGMVQAGSIDDLDEFFSYKIRK